MLDHDLKGRSLAEFRNLPSPKLVAIYSFRFDAMLVPALKENLWSVVDGFVSWDDREAQGVFSSEGERRQKLIEEARRLGADWVLGVDPDERFEKCAGQVIRACMAKRPAIWGFNVRELYEPDKYRSDGIWDRKQVMRLFPISKDMVFDYDPLHSHFPPIYPVYPVRQTRVNFYHLKMLDARRRAARRDLYTRLDPDWQYQAIGYDYLTDEDGLELTEIPPERGYAPPHHDTGDLWMADLTHSEAEEPATPASRNMTEDDTSDTADHSFVHDPDAKHLLARADALSHQGRFAEREALLSAEGPALDIAGRIDQLRFQPPLGKTTEETCFCEMGWSEGDVSIAWGCNARAFAPMAAIAIGVGAPPELKGAVSSLLSQSEQASVIVVNSGGGDLQARLGDLADRVIAVSVPERVFVGAARNIGVYLSNATWISFLAGDCVARPDWIANRLKKHLAGFAAVSTPVVNSHPASAVAWAYHLSLYALRLPDTPERFRINYGLSVERDIIVQAGYYDPSLRVGEDTALNRKIAVLGKIGFAEDALTEHKAETGLYRALVEHAKRGRRAARLMPTMANRSLEPRFGQPWFALRSEVIRTFRGKYSRVLRIRRGLEAPDKRLSFKLGIALLPLFSLADSVGRGAVFPQELRLRRQAQRIISALGSGNIARAKALLATLADDASFGEMAARELAAELARAGLSDAALDILGRISRFYGVSSDVKRLKRAIEDGRFVATPPDESQQP